MARAASASPCKTASTHSVPLLVRRLRMGVCKSRSSTKLSQAGVPSARRCAGSAAVVLRRAAEVAHKSLTDFILDSACLAAEQALLDQRLFMVSGSQYQALMDLLDRPEQANEGLRDLFARKAPWDTK